MIVDQARYHDGRRLPCGDISETLDDIRASGSSDFLWIGMRDPSDETFERVSEELGLHPLAIEDSVTGDQRPKIERYGDGHFVVLRPLRYVEASSDVESGEIMVFIGADHIVTIRKGEASPLAGLRSRLEADGHDALRHGPWGSSTRSSTSSSTSTSRSRTRSSRTSTTSRPGSFPPTGRCRPPRSTR
ncbi:hypothetical protein ON003_01115 [Janibacter hoylei]|uniref:CorA family divalent cation transporter n=1 Tax=Janibacter hoylei TaxID=364298 RepID=UPI00223898DA|nr:CorA family divalent cation transporter [Janibacter hoylei]MCW4600365.1 hypothetical protein [Janibacter hoylei]